MINLAHLKPSFVDPSLEALATAHGQGRQGISKRTLQPRSKTSVLRQRFTGELRELWRRVGADLRSPAVQALIERGVAPVAGGATGMDGAAFMHNLPPEGTYIMDSDLFFQQTERNDVPQSSTEYPGFGGGAIDKQISNVGVLAGIQLIVEGTLKVTGIKEEKGTVTASQQWPWNLMKNFALSANGQTSLLSAEGMDLRARRQRVYRNPRDPISVAPSMDEFGDPEAKALTEGEHPVFLVYDVPIIHDWFTLTGALFAQSDQIYLSWHFVPPAESELFTKTGEGKVTFEGTVRTTNTFFDVPFADTQKGRKVLVPDLSWLHGFVSSDQFFSNQGEVPSPLIRTSGELLAYYAYLQNGAVATIDPTALSAIRFEYGGNRKPRVHEPPETLLAKNVEDYNGRILPKAGYFVFDFEADNPSRDLVFPKGVTELKTVVVVPTEVEVKENAKVHFVEEALFAGR